MSFDPVYATQVLSWAAAWGGIGLAARAFIASADAKQARRRRDRSAR